jgi:hypothetical protein
LSHDGGHKAGARADGNQIGLWPSCGAVRPVIEPATKRNPRFAFQPHGRGVDWMLHQPVHTSLRPHTHCMKHKVAYVGLLPLNHHVVVFVNMENVRWYDVVCPPFRPPPCESVMVTFHNHGHGAASPVQQTLQTYTGFGQLVEIVEINIKDGVHSGISPAKNN